MEANISDGADRFSFPEDFDDVPTLKFCAPHKSYEITVCVDDQTLTFFTDGASMADVERKIVQMFGAATQIINIDVCMS